MMGHWCYVHVYLELAFSSKKVAGRPYILLFLGMVFLESAIYVMISFEMVFGFSYISCRNQIQKRYIPDHWFWNVPMLLSCQYLCIIHTLYVHYAHAAANLSSGYSKYGKAACMHCFCTIAL